MNGGLGQKARVAARVVVAAVLLLAGVTVMAAPAAALTRFVNCNANESLQAMVTAADPGDVILVSGFCAETSITIDKNLSILGFFSATLDGGGGTNGSRTVVTVRSGNVTLENLIVQGGKSGMVIGSAVVSMTNVDIVDNFDSTEPGGGLGVGTGSFVTFKDGRISGNSDEFVGGGIKNDGSLFLFDAVVDGNRVMRTTSGGGGISNSGLVVLTDSVLSNNYANVGGGITNFGTARFVRSSINDNFGGGIHNRGELDIDRSAIIDNGAGFVSATADRGGGLRNAADGVATISNTTFAENGAVIGAAIANEGGSVDLVAVTISQNQAYPPSRGSTGGGIYNEGDLGMTSSVVAGNVDYSDNCAGPVPMHTHGYNVVDPTCQFHTPAAGDRFVGDPKLRAAEDNGGGALTMRPLAGSPVVDNGSCATSVDQRGVTRPRGGACDAGAYENRLPTAPGVPTLSAGSNPNTGTFTLSWNASTDADGDPVSYRLERRDANDGSWSSTGTAGGAGRGYAGHVEGTHRFRVVATDGNNETAPSNASSAIVVDRTAPAAPSISADRAPDHVDDDGNSWYADSVTVTVQPGADPLLVDGSAGTGTVTSASTHDYSTDGPHTTTRMSTDAAGNTSAEASLTVHVDTTIPSVAFDMCPTSVLLGAAATAPWSASDTGSGLAGFSGGDLALDASTVGAKTAYVVASDNVGHQASAACTYSVVYDFTGFGAPLRVAPPSMNDVTAGQNIPVRFRLAGNQGLDILASAPTLTPISCSTLEEMAAPSPTGEARPLAYDSRRDEYTYWWATDRALKRTCVRFDLTLDDGTTHSVNVSFR